jgi:peptide/nickel transport system substrate-binding protein
MKLTRLFAFVALLILVMSVGMVSAQDGEVTMIIGWEQEPDIPTPLSNSAFSTYTSYFYSRDVWDFRGEEREIYPIMVEEIPSPDNGLVTTVEVEGGEAPVVTYKLREGMLWSDGEPVTAEDCMFYHNWMMQPDPVDSFQRGFYPEVVASAEMVDELTVTVTYNQPWPDYLTDAPLSCAYPAHKLLGDNSEGFTMDTDGDGVFDANADDAPFFSAFANIDPAELVGYGPYVVESFNAGQNMTFVRNENWGINDFETEPAIDTFILQFIPESAQMENAMNVGDIDLAFNFNSVDNGYDEMENVGTFIVPGVFVDAIWMNSGPFAFAAMQDVRVREALVHAIDRRGIADQFGGEGAGQQLTTSWFPPQFTNPDVGFREYDVEMARTMLTEAGWVDDDADEGTTEAPTFRVSQGVEGTPDGTPLILRFYTTPVLPRPDIQTVIQGQLRQVGVGTQLFVVDGPTALFATFSNRGILTTGSYDLAMYALSNDPLSPNGSPDEFHCSGIPSVENPEGGNGTWFCDEEYDRLDNLVATTNDPEERLELGYGRDPLHFASATWHSIRPRPTAWAVRTDRFDISTISVGTLTGNYFQTVEEWQPVQ